VEVAAIELTVVARGVHDPEGLAFFPEKLNHAEPNNLPGAEIRDDVNRVTSFERQCYQGSRRNSL
jgi:hypothetical protein